MARGNGWEFGGWDWKGDEHGLCNTVTMGRSRGNWVMVGMGIQARLTTIEGIIEGCSDA